MGAKSLNLHDILPHWGRFNSPIAAYYQTFDVAHYPRIKNQLLLDALKLEERIHRFSFWTVTRRYVSLLELISNDWLVSFLTEMQKFSRKKKIALVRPLGRNVDHLNIPNDLKEYINHIENAIRWMELYTENCRALQELSTLHFVTQFFRRNNRDDVAVKWEKRVLQKNLDYQKIYPDMKLMLGRVGFSNLFFNFIYVCSSPFIPIEGWNFSFDGLNKMKTAVLSSPQYSVEARRKIVVKDINALPEQKVKTMPNWEFVEFILTSLGESLEWHHKLRKAAEKYCKDRLNEMREVYEQVGLQFPAYRENLLIPSMPFEDLAKEDYLPRLSQPLVEIEESDNTFTIMYRLPEEQVTQFIFYDITTSIIKKMLFDEKLSNFPVLCWWKKSGKIGEEDRRLCSPCTGIFPKVNQDCLFHRIFNDINIK